MMCLDCLWITQLSFKHGASQFYWFRFADASLSLSFATFYFQNATKAIKSEPSIKVPVEEAPSTHSEPEEPVSPAHVPSPSREKSRKKASKPPKSPKPPKPPKMPKAPKPPKVPKVKEGGKKKAKKVKESSPPPRPSSFAALESHAKDILSKMDQSKKTKVSGDNVTVASATISALASSQST